MSQQSHPYRTNRDLFSNHYLTEHLRQTEPWEEVDQDEVREAYDEIHELWTDKQDRVADYNEAQLERNFIRPVFDILGIPFEIEETVMRNARRPDYGFFPSADAADAAFDRDDFYEESIAVADAKRWGRKLDTRGEEKRDFENPSYQIHRYLQETPTQWAVLTNGEKWRLYYGPTSHRLDSYYEIDLPELLDAVDRGSDFEAFKEFYLFFRQEAFLPDQTGDSFLDDVYDESSIFAEELGEDLQENIYEAIRVLAEGFLDTNDDLNEDDLDLIHDSSLIYLYRLIFVLYAESEGRDLLPTDNEIYSESYSLNELKLEVVENRDATQQHYQTWQTGLWDQLNELFVLIDQGSRGMDIPKDDLYIPAYNGGLFRTNPDKDDTVESQFLSNYGAGDAYLAEVIELLTRHEADEGKGKVFVDYSSLDERNLGSIYEGLLEYKLDVADEPLTVDDGEYTPAEEDEDITVEAGEVYLRTDDGERKATGSYYTPEYVVEYIVDETLGPLVDEIRTDLMSQSADTTHSREGGFADDFADRIFDLTVLDPAMGSGHFPVNAVDYLARKIIDAQEKQDRQAMDAEDAEVRAPTTKDGELRDINWARRKVAQRCIYGVDVNPLATELAKVSLWLRTLAAEQPLAFLDHHLKTGNSLVGSDIEDVLADDGDAVTEDGQLTLQQSFDHTRQRAMEHVTDRFQDLLNIDNETLEDAKEMEAVYDDVRADPLYKKLLAMANVHTANAFGLDVPDDADERMARALHSEAWENIEQQDWFKSAQALAEDERFFHWELEFPIAFYDQDGERRADAGFDAVIGNPPYINISGLPENQRDYLRGSFSETFAGNSDILYYFMQTGTDILRPGGRQGLIVARYFTQARYADGLRQYLLDHSKIEKIVDFGNFQVFPSVDVLTHIFINTHDEEAGEYDVSILNLIDEDVSDNYVRQRLPAEDSSAFSEVDLDSTTLTKHPWNLIDKDTLYIKQKMEEQGWPLGDHYDIVQSMQTGFNEGLVVDDDTVAEYDLEEELLRKLAKTKNVRRYLIKDLGQYVLWTEVEDIDDYPNTKEYLQQYRNDLADRYDIQQRDANWWQISNPRNEELFDRDESRILTPFMSTSNKFAIDTEKRFNDGGDIRALFEQGSSAVSMRYVLSVLNSSLGEFYHKNTAKLKRDGYYEYYGNALKKFPIFSLSPVEESPARMDTVGAQYQEYLNGSRECFTWVEDNKGELEEVPSVTHGLLTSFSEQMRILREKRISLNLDLLDYLGNYTEGPDLPDIGLFQPTGSNILDATTEDYDKLQVERARTARDGQSITIEATARYKPEDEDEFETDTYGYTETDFFEAFTLTDLSNEEAALVEAFVPVAVDEEIGGFRDNATKTNSLIDRLKRMTLPDPDDVADDLRRYIETKERADELDEKIEKTDQLIDEIVYDLYDLTEEEIEIVEEAVNSD